MNKSIVSCAKLCHSEFMTVSHVAQSCFSVIGNKPFLWSNAKFDPPL